MNYFEFKAVDEHEQITFGRNNKAMSLYCKKNELIEGREYLKCTYEIIKISKLWVLF